MRIDRSTLNKVALDMISEAAYLALEEAKMTEGVIHKIVGILEMREKLEQVLDED